MLYFIHYIFAYVALSVTCVPHYVICMQYMHALHFALLPHFVFGMNDTVWAGCVALCYYGGVGMMANDGAVFWWFLQEIEVKQCRAQLVHGWVTVHDRSRFVAQWGVLMQHKNHYRMTPDVRHSGIVNWLIYLFRSGIRDYTACPCYLRVNIANCWNSLF